MEEEDRAGEEEGRRGWPLEEEDRAGEEEGRRGWPVEEEDRAGEEEGRRGWAGGSPIRPDTNGCTDLGHEISTWAVQCYKYILRTKELKLTKTKSPCAGWPVASCTAMTE